MCIYICVCVCVFDDISLYIYIYIYISMPHCLPCWYPIFRVVTEKLHMYTYICGYIYIYIYIYTHTHAHTYGQRHSVCKFKNLHALRKCVSLSTLCSKSMASSEACVINFATPVPSFGGKLSSICVACFLNLSKTSWGGVPKMLCILSAFMCACMCVYYMRQILCILSAFMCVCKCVYICQICSKYPEGVPKMLCILSACVRMCVYIYVLTHLVKLIRAVGKADKMTLYIYIYTHTYIHTYVFGQAHSCLGKADKMTLNMYIYTHTYIHTYVFGQAHSCVGKADKMTLYIYIYTHTYIHTYVFGQAHSCLGKADKMTWSRKTRTQLPRDPFYNYNNRPSTSIQEPCIYVCICI
jgi:hypothetical protein